MGRDMGAARLAFFPTRPYHPVSPSSPHGQRHLRSRWLNARPSEKKTGCQSIEAFCLRMREMSEIFWVRRHFLFLNALLRVFKRVIYVVRKILSREIKNYNKFPPFFNTVDIHSVCRNFGWGYINDQSANRTR